MEDKVEKESEIDNEVVEAPCVKYVYKATKSSSFKSEGSLRRKPLCSVVEDKRQGDC